VGSINLPDQEESQMPYHVDVIGNELMTGKQKLFGRVHVDGELRIEAEDEGRLLETLRQVVPDIDPDEDPAGFVAALTERMDYTYVIASVQHAGDECPFDAIGGEPVREQPSAHTHA
jgi:hypothetical protein